MSKQKRKHNLILSFLAAWMTISFIAVAVPAVKAEAAIAKPGNCRFHQWNSETSCAILWNQVSGAEGYQIKWSWTDGSHAQNKNLSSGYYGWNITIQKNHVYQATVRAFCTVKGKKEYSAWSNLAFITPFPSSTGFTSKASGKVSNPSEIIKWKPIYGSSGYNVFLTTNPNGNWYWNQSTATKATATSATIKKYRGSKLKTYQNYYVRVVTRRKRNGVFCTVPVPSAAFCQIMFRLKPVK